LPFFIHSNISKQEHISEIYYLSDGKCTLLEMESIIIISKKEELTVEQINLEVLIGFYWWIYIHSVKLSYGVDLRRLTPESLLTFVFLVILEEKKWLIDGSHFDIICFGAFVSSMAANGARCGPSMINFLVKKSLLMHNSNIVH